MTQLTTETPGKRRLLRVFCLAVTGGAVAVVGSRTVGWDPTPHLMPLFLFTLLNVAATRLALRLAPGQKISLAHVAMVASFQVYGLPAALWSTLLGALISDLLRAWRPLPEDDSRRSTEEGARGACLNAGMHVLALAAGGAIFSWSGGTLPVEGVTRGNLVPLLGLFLGYFLVEITIFLLYLALQGTGMTRYVLRFLPRIVLVELFPLPASILIASIYNQQNLGNLILLIFGFIALAWVAYRLNLSRQDLQQRVEELSALNAIGRELSRFLDLEALLEVIYRETRKVLDMRNFYVALYDAEEGMLHFPLAYVDGRRQQWQSRPFGNGLTEYVIRSCEPLLLRENEEVEAARLGIQPVGRPSRSWLGVPLVAGQEVLGMMAVQDYERNAAYDESHRDLFSTVAAQAAVAIRNAQQYQQTDQQLADRVRQLQAVLDSSIEGILFLDTRGRVLMANPRLRDFWGVERDELARLDLFAHPDLLEKAGLPLSSSPEDLFAAAEGQGEALVPVSGPGGRVAERLIAPVRGGGGDVVGWLVTFRDVTEDRKLEILREDLSQMMVHDLRSPLSAIATALKMMQELGRELSPARMEQLLEVGLRGVDRLDTMIQTLLEIARLQSGELRPERVPLVLSDLVEEVVRHLMPLAQAAHIRVTTKIPRQLPYAHADLSLVERTLSNLLDNAIKFSPDGSEIVIQAEVVAGKDGQDWLQISVADEGPGVPAGYHDVIFEKFGQVRGAPGRRRGAGLGLTFCRLAVDAHGGEISLRCPEGGGSIFWFTLPIAPPEALEGP